MNATKATTSVCCFRTFGLIVGWAALLLPIQAYALSLGGFQVESALDEPLRGEIQLEAVDAETLESLEVTLGTLEDFQRADVPRSEFLQQLQFTVTETEDGNAVVEVTSEQAMTEPFLHFLVSAEWSGGKLVREYTGLLDPPLYAGESPAEVESPAIEAGQMTQAAEPAAEQPAEPADTGSGTSITPSTTASSGGRSAEYGPTQEGDTLWEIASRLDTGAVQANVFQIMIALQRQNPDAFIDNNVNRLRTGAVLRLDDLAAIAAIPAEQASAAYTAQLEEWQSYRTQVASASGEAGASGDAAESAAAPEETTEAAMESSTDQAAADTGTTPEAAAAESAAGQDDVLRIVQATVDESEQSQAASAGSDRSGEIAEMQSQIATLQESLESRNLENEELRERVRLLESQLENAQRLIEIESQELAAAQQQAAQAQQEAAQARQQAAQAAQAAAATSESVASQSDAQTSPEQVAAQSVQPVEEAGQESMESSSATQEPESAVDTSAAAPASQESATQDTQAAQQASATNAAAGQSQSEQAAQDGTQKVRTVTSSSSQSTPWWSQITDLLFSSWMWMVGAGLGVLVLVLGLLMFLRRRQSIAEFEESILSGSALDSYSETTDTAATSASDTSFLSDFGTAGMGTMQADEVDPLAEAEVYLAYGRDEQAEDVLKEAARRDPERSEVKLKLLEIYKQRNDVKSFETIAEELYPAGDSGDREVWSQVTAMGRELNPDNPLFQESGHAGTQAPTMAAHGTPAPAAVAPADEPSEAMNFDLDELAPTQDKAPAAPPPAAQSAAPGDELEFDLEAGMAAESESPAAETVAAGGDERTLDFGEDFMQQRSANVDPATQPFPAPDQQTELDRELERLAGEREATSAPPAGGNGQSPSQEASWERAESDAGTLDFPSTDTSDIDFDLNLDETSIQQLSGSESREAPGGAQQSAAGDSAAASDDDSDGVLEFESENIPPEETWAGPSSDVAPAADSESVAYSPSDDVKSAGAPQYNEAETKLDLARAYLDMGDKVGARSIIDEVMREGDPAQRDQAAELASQL